MFTFPKSIADPAAAPVAGFVANKAVVPKSDGADSFGRALEGATASRDAAAADSATTRDVAGLDNDNSEDKFLTLLIAQMRNQDPLNPLDNAEVTSQLAQINTVRGIEKLNTSMGTLIDRIGAQGVLDAAGLIGREVLAEGDTLVVGEDASLPGPAAAFELSASATDVSLQVFDEAGLSVADMPLGALAAGVHPFSWDGRDAEGQPLNPGTYYFQISAMADGNAVEAVPLAPARVVGVTRNSAGYDLELDSGALVERDAIRGIR